MLLSFNERNKPFSVLYLIRYQNASVFLLTDAAAIYNIPQLCDPNTLLRDIIYSLCCLWGNLQNKLVMQANLQITILTSYKKAQLQYAALQELHREQVRIGNSWLAAAMVITAISYKIKKGTWLNNKE